MATRTPTTFSTAEPALRPRKAILSAAADDMFDDQQLVLEKDEPVILDNFRGVYASNPAGWHTMRIYRTKAPHLCGTSSLISAQCSLFAYSGNAANFDVGIYHNGRGVRQSLTVTADHTTGIWRDWFTVTLYGGGAENELFIQVNDTTSPAFPALYVGGVALFTNM